MQVRVETDNHIEGRQELLAYVESVVRDAVGRHVDHLTHVEAHLGDANSGDKSGPNDMRCLLEARVAGIKTIAVSHHAESLHLAIGGAVNKLRHALESALGKLQDRQRRAEGTGPLSVDISDENPDAV